MTRRAIATVVSDDFVPGAKVLLSTLRRHHVDLDRDLVILHESEVAPLSSVSQSELSAIWPDVMFRHADLSPYDRLFQQRDEVLQTPARLRAAFVILDSFRMTEYEQVVCLDSDMLILGPLDDLLDSEAGFAVVPAIDERTLTEREFFNTGVMVIGAEHLTGSTFDDLVERTVMTSVDRERGKADQAVLNRYFETRPYDHLPQRFNVTKRMVPDSIGDVESHLLSQEARVLHFVGAKPWNINWSEREWGFETVEALWWDEFLSIPGAPSLREVFARRRAEILQGVSE